jgi:hypothetical protein
MNAQAWSGKPFPAGMVLQVGRRPRSTVNPAQDGLFTITPGYGNFS